MYGQMTAGSWIYIGTPGHPAGHLRDVRRRRRAAISAARLAGRLVVTAGLGGMGGAQPLAATMNGAAALVVEVDPAAHRAPAGDAVSRRGDRQPRRGARRGSTRGPRDGVARSIGLRGNAADVLPELVARGVTPDVLTDQTSAHDALNGYVPERHVARRGDPPARAQPGRVHRAVDGGDGRARARDARRCSSAARSRSTTATTSARRRSRPASTNAFDIPGFVPEYIRPLFCEGKGPFRWAALSGDPDDIRVTDEAALEMFADDEALVPLDPPGARARRVPGAAGAHLLARLRRARAVRTADQRAGARRARQGADRHRPRSPRHRIGRVAEPRDRRHARRQRRDRRLADPERAAQRVERRHLGVGPPRRRRRHRLLAARRHGDRRRRDRPMRTRSSSAC